MGVELSGRTLLDMGRGDFADAAIRYPEVTLQVHSDMVTPRQTEQLLDGRLSVGVLRPPVTVSGIAVETIRHEPVVVILASRHPATVQRQIDLSDLRALLTFLDSENGREELKGIGGLSTQTVGVLSRIKGILDEHGLGMGDVVKMQVFLVHNTATPMDFKAFMEGYTQFFGGSQPNLPARSVVGVAALANPGFLVEIEVIAVKDNSK
jgi:enamine deaminase RidA (YjgF/YER057c/UK114 family)